MLIQGVTVDLLMQLMNRVQTAVADVVLWQRSTQMCSREAHELMYALMFGWLVMLIFSVWLYRRINPPKPKKGALAPEDGSQKCLEPTAPSL
jgi:hypothetical protein